LASDMKNEGVSQSGAKGGLTGWPMKAAGVLILFGICAFVYLLFTASSKPEPQGGAALAKGEMERLVVLEAAPPMPTATLKTEDGGETTLQAYAGEVVLVNFWATWCAPCVTEMPTLAALQRRFGDRMKVVPVNLDTVADAPGAATELRRLSDGALPFLTEPTRAILWAAEARGMPTTILYGRDGVEIARLTGDADWDSDEAVALIEAALAEN
jgi:thiol-disulfide isomerase/thioredoxin